MGMRLAEGSTTNDLFAGITVTVGASIPEIDVDGIMDVYKVMRMWAFSQALAGLFDGSVAVGPKA